jgi:hypothetical protein
LVSVRTYLFAAAILIEFCVVFDCSVLTSKNVIFSDKKYCMLPWKYGNYMFVCLKRKSALRPSSQFHNLT